MVHVLGEVDALPEGPGVGRLDVDEEVRVGDLLRETPGRAVEEVDLVPLVLTWLGPDVFRPAADLRRLHLERVDEERPRVLPEVLEEPGWVQLSALESEEPSNFARLVLGCIEADSRK